MAVEEKKDDFKRPRQKCLKFKKSPESEQPDNGKCRSGFPTYVTVDELRFYRKRKPAFAWPSNNLKIEEGDFKLLKSEYKRRFKNFYDAINRSLSEQKDVLTVQPLKPEVSLTLEGLHDFQSEYNESFSKQLKESLTQPSNVSQIMDDGVATSEPPAVTVPQLEIHTRKSSRLLKRPTNLKIEGDNLFGTEYAEKFIQYLIEKRAELLRTPTTLKLEGDMETKTENRDNFIKYDKPERAHLCRKFSNLHLEGELDIMTEKQEKFMPFEVHKRPPLKKKSTNLHLEGDLNLIPEYTRQYVEYKNSERPKLAVPVNHFKLDGLLENNSEDNLLHQRMHPLIPFLREPAHRVEDITDHRRRSTRSLYLSENRERRNESKGYLGTGKSASHPNLNYASRAHIHMDGPMELNPEYKTSYIDHHKYGKIPPRVKPLRHSELDYMRTNVKMEAKPEYSSSYVNFPRQRPSIRKPESHLSSEGEVNHVTEQNERFIPHTYTEKTESCRRKSELTLEGPFECQPEYRKAYIDYLIREKKPADQRRAFELVSTTEETDHEAKQNLSDGEQPAPTDYSEAPSEQDPEKSKSHLTVPTSKDSSSTSSARSSPKSSAKPSSKPRKLSQIEESAFGPRCPKRMIKKSLTSSTLPPSGRYSKMRSRDVSPQLVPDLSKLPQRRSHLSCPAIGEVASSERNMWTESSRSDKAFFILDDKVPSRRADANNLYKEQKWMPSWDYPIQ